MPVSSDSSSESSDEFYDAENNHDETIKFK